MEVEVVIWLAVNTVAAVVSGHDFVDTFRIWSWVRSNNGTITKQDEKVAFRSFRLAAVRFLLSFMFIIAGLVAALNFLPRDFVAWFLVAAAILVTADVLAEARYRSVMFGTSKELREELNRRQ